MAKTKILMSPHKERLEIAKANYPQYNIDVRSVNSWTPEIMAEYDICCPQTDKQCRIISEMDLPDEKMVIVQRELFKLFTDKSKFNYFMIENGFSENIPSMNPTTSPVIVKPNLGFGSHGIYLEYRDEYEIQEGFFAQEYITNGEFEYTTNIVVKGGNIVFTKSFKYYFKAFGGFVRHVPHWHRLKFLENGGVVEIDLPEIALDFYKEVIKFFKIEGTFNSQFTIIDGVVKIFEINGRMGAPAIHFFDEIIESNLV